MRTVNVTELRQHLPEYLKRVSKGEPIQITVHGHVVARMVPESDAVAEARAKRGLWRKTVHLGDVESPIDVKWTADADNL